MIEQLKYPIGKYDMDTYPFVDQNISTIQSFPERIRKAVEQLTNEQLDTPYRPAGWTIRQVVHHCADSHMNAMIRFKLTLTEDTPAIKPYHEAEWAELVDSKSYPIAASLNIIQGIHARWTVLLKSLTEADLQKEYFHPDKGRNVPLSEAIGMYAWHSNHHLAHVTNLKQTRGWE